MSNQHRVPGPHTPLAVALAVALGLVATTSAAATLEVTSRADPGTSSTCTLRQAIASMNGSVLAGACSNTGNAFGSGDRIVFDTTAFPAKNDNRITLTDGQLVINDAHLSIDATANGGVTIDADHASRVINAAAGSGGSLHLNHLRLLNGKATSGCFGFLAGGAICDLRTQLTLIASTVSDSSAAQMGGGIFAYNSALVIVGSTISGNSTAPDGTNGLGGGIFFGSNNSSSSLTMLNSTVSGNTAVSKGGGVFLGAIGSTLVNNTISANSAGDGGGGIYASYGLTITDSIVAGNVGGDVHAASVTGSRNLIGGEPLLGPLVDNGGPTWSRSPQPDSPAIDAVACDGALPTDQRGVLRPQGFACDIGAVEVATAQTLVASQGSGQSQSVWQDFFNPLVVQALGPANRPAPYVHLHATSAAAGQPGALCSDAITNGSGHAYLYCRANGFVGNYHVAVHAVDAPSVAPAVFVLSNEPGDGDTIFLDGFDTPGPVVAMLAGVGSAMFHIDPNCNLPAGRPVPVNVITNRRHEPLLRIDAMRHKNAMLLRLTRYSDHGRHTERGVWRKAAATPVLQVTQTPKGIRAWLP